MKLKKIVSLALAGVMAVGMLAGCSTNGTTSDDGDDTTVITTSGVSADVKDRIEKNGYKMPSYVTFKDSADLDADLKYATQFAGVREVLAGNILVDRQLQAVTNNNLVTELDEAAGSTNDTLFNIGANDTLLGVEYNAGQSVTLPNAVAVQAYVVSGEIEDDARNEMIAWAIQDAVTAYQYTVDKNYIPSEQAGGNFNFSYEVSVSVCDVTRSSTIIAGTGAENPDVTFVAVQVVRTAAHQ